MIQNLLIVTDHTHHSSTNSLYELAVALTNVTGKLNVWVCSRGIKENENFFKGLPDATIYAALINNTFSFNSSGLFFNIITTLDRKIVDAILVRMPQPLNKNFLTSLETIVPPEKIINRPEGTIETSSKAFLLTVSHLCPHVTLCMNVKHAVDLSQEEEIVLKPLYSYGGRGIVRVSKQFYWEGDKRYPVSEFSRMLSEDHFPMLAMKYLKNVVRGDKRTIVVNRQMLGSAIRFPGPDSWICNVAQGGHAIIAQPEEAELMIESELTPLLYQKGVIMYGFDTLVDDNGIRVLSEINTLSIGGISPMTEMSGKPIMKMTAELLVRYLEHN